MSLDSLKSIFEEKKVAIVGFGKEGRSTLNFLNTCSKLRKICVFDEGQPTIENNSENLSTLLNANLNEVDFSEFDFVIKSPGIALSKFNAETLNSGKLSSQTELYLSVFKDQTIGITGTKGKSTNSKLLCKILSLDSNIDVILSGNIGIPFFDIVSKISSKSIVVAELSCHQLENSKHSPSIAVLLNMFEEHLDHYKGPHEYFMTKVAIYLNQRKDDRLFVNTSDPITAKYLKNYSAKSGITDTSSPKELLEEKILTLLNAKAEDFKPQIKGYMNLQNIYSCALVAKHLSVSDSTILDGINQFQPLPHRLEYVGNIAGKEVYNDSISTIPESAIAALETLGEKVNSLILGGFDRHINYDKLIHYLIHHPQPENLLFFDTAGLRMKGELEELNNKQGFDALKNKTLKHFDDFQSMLQFGINQTEDSKILLLSPAASSYGKFKNFEERGQKFRKLLEELK